MSTTHYFWATICKTVRPMRSNHYLSVSLSVLTCLLQTGQNRQRDNGPLSLTLLYCGQMVGWIQTKLGKPVGLALATAPNFRPISVAAKSQDATR